MRFYAFFFCLLFATLSAPATHAQTLSSSEKSPVTLQGNIHFYQGRYILKGKTPEQLSVLLENTTLEKLVAGLQPGAKYSVCGEIYSFHSTRYLFPTSFVLLPQIKDEKTQKTKKGESKTSSVNKPIAKERKLTRKKVERALLAKKGPLGEYEIVGSLKPCRIKIAEHKYYNFDFTGELAQKKGGKKVGIVVKVKNCKQKIYGSESKKFAVARERFQTENGYSQVVAIYLCCSDFSSPAKRFLEENGTYSTTIADFVK